MSLILEKLTKERAARRMIDKAIIMHVQQEDAVAIHVIAEAAATITRDVCLAKKKKPFNAHLEDYIQPELIHEFRRQMRKTFNFLKHAKDDPNGEIEFAIDEANDLSLFVAAEDYKTAYEKITPTMLVFLAWFSATHSDIFKHTPNYSGALEKLFPAERMLTRADQKTGARSWIESARRLMPLDPLSMDEMSVAIKRLAG